MLVPGARDSGVALTLQFIDSSNNAWLGGAVYIFFIGVLRCAVAPSEVRQVGRQILRLIPALSSKEK